MRMCKRKPIALLAILLHLHPCWPRISERWGVEQLFWFAKQHSSVWIQWYKQPPVDYPFVDLCWKKETGGEQFVFCRRTWRVLRTPWGKRSWKEYNFQGNPQWNKIEWASTDPMENLVDVNWWRENYKWKGLHHDLRRGKEFGYGQEILRILSSGGWNWSSSQFLWAVGTVRKTQRIDGPGSRRGTVTESINISSPVIRKNLQRFLIF